jgi:MFS family permease
VSATPAISGAVAIAPRRAPMGAAYWWLWTSAAMSNLADGILKVALPLVAIEFTRSPALIAGLAFAFTLPWLLFALAAGAIADRVSRRALMLAANTARMTLIGALLAAVALHAGSIWMLYAAAFLTGVAETFYDTAAQAILPQIVRRDQLQRANNMLYAAETTALELAGPPLAGLLVMTGAVLPIATPTALWAVAVILLLLVQGSFRTRRGRGSARPALRTDVAEGLRFLARSKLLRTITVMTGTFNFASGATQAIFVLYAVGSTSAMGLTGAQYGWLLSASAAGWLAGSFLTGRAVRLLGRARVIGLSYALGALSIGIPAATTNAFVIGSVFFIGGAGLMIGNVTTLSLRQAITPGPLLGRINSCHRLVAYGTKPLGTVAGGLLAQLLGLHVVFLVMGPLALTALFWMKNVTNDAMDAAERDAPPAPT